MESDAPYGGWVDRKTTDPIIKEQADYAAQHVWPGCDVDKIVKAKSQVVAGMNYSIDMLLSRGRNEPRHISCRVKLFAPPSKGPKILDVVQTKYLP